MENKKVYKVVYDVGNGMIEKTVVGEEELEKVKQHVRNNHGELMTEFLGTQVEPQYKTVTLRFNKVPARSWRDFVDILLSSIDNVLNMEVFVDGSLYYKLKDGHKVPVEGEGVENE